MISRLRTPRGQWCCRAPRAWGRLAMIRQWRDLCGKVGQLLDDRGCHSPQVLVHRQPSLGARLFLRHWLSSHSCAMHDESGLGRCVQGHGNIGNPASYTNLPLSSRACIRADSSCHALSLQFQCPPGKHRPAGFAMQNLCCQGEAPQIHNLHQLKYLKLR